MNMSFFDIGSLFDVVVDALRLGRQRFQSDAE